jgi:hypothetical protein
VWTLADTAAARYLMQVTLVRALSVFTDKYHTVSPPQKIRARNSVSRRVCGIIAFHGLKIEGRGSDRKLRREAG